MGSDDAVAIWLNGREVHRHEGKRSYSAKSDHITVHLKRGRNELLVKNCGSEGGGGFCVHVEDGHGKPLTQVKPR
ncbi:hypothetical protein, partial [Mesorhizobium japonicum]|uniref:hypothetical protein n=1 Tax=Mesorhizobium japonicum TaxID=2066070 RepID=UPI003B5ADCB9